MIKAILILILIIIIEALVIALLIYLLVNKRTRKINAYNNAMKLRDKVLFDIETNSKKKREETNVKIKNATNIDDLKRIFTSL